MALSNIQEIIERSVFERIRLTLVKYGYIPDITLYTSDPMGQASYQAAIDNIVTTKGFSIDLFNEGSNFNKGLKVVPRIVVNSGGFLEGGLGGDPRKFFEPDNNGNYNTLVTPPQTSSFFLDIHLVSKTTAQSRILNAILSEALPKRKYVPFYNEPSKNFLIQHLNYYEGDDATNGLIEKVNAYEIPDCWDSEFEGTDFGLASIKRITLETELEKYPEGGIDYSTDSLVVYTNKMRCSINCSTNFSIHNGIPN